MSYQFVLLLVAFGLSCLLGYIVGYKKVAKSMKRCNTKFGVPLKRNPPILPVENIVEK